jgi:RNA-directed DNA polymerase
MVHGERRHAEALREEVAAVLAPMGLRLAPEKTAVVHIDEGFDFLGFRIQRQTKRGSNKRYVYPGPARKALASIKAKVKAITKQGTNQPLSAVLRQLNGVLRGWTTYFRHGVSKATFGYLDSFVWHRVTQWLLKRHKRITWAELYRRFLTGRPGNRPAVEGIIMFDAATMPASTLVQTVGRFETRESRRYARHRGRVMLRAATAPMTAPARWPCRRLSCGIPAAARPTCRFRSRDGG